jgi:hypothetical protein
MAYIGGSNPIPTQVGGGLSLVHAIYKTLRSVVGEGNYAPEDIPGETIEGSWRWARALGLAAAFADDRAVFQMFPDRCHDMIPVYEEILGITPASDASDESRRAEIVRRWVLATTAVKDDLETELQRIDPLFSIIYAGYDAADTTENGRAFEDYVPGSAPADQPAFGGGRKSTIWPNYSSDYVVIVQYNVAAGALSAAQKRLIEDAKAVLNEVLPSHVSFAITANPTGGFILDQSLLDFGAFNP